MHLAIVHYHLRRGGVTQVMVNHLRALSATACPGQTLRVVVLHGGEHDAWPSGAMDLLPGLEVTRREVSGLDYDDAPVARPRELAARMAAALSDAGMSAADTILHVHNHALGKNASLPGAIAQLTDRGYRCLLQLHDFSEDFRPADHQHLLAALSVDHPDRLPQQLYAHGPTRQYAVLNRRDYALLRRAGMPADRLRILPNPIAPYDQLPARSVARSRLAEKLSVSARERYIVYPIRGIRRKNLGELLLWGATAAPTRSVWLGVTLPPSNPREQPRYAWWRQCAAACRLPVLFDVGTAGCLTFGENLAAADAVINTSVAEGFGMVFLEPWLAGLPLIGRDLPEITTDFTAAGVQFDTLAPHLRIPLDWVGAAEFARQFTDGYRRVLAAYGRPAPDAAALARDIAGLARDGLLDFAHCPSRLQAEVVDQVASSPARRARLLELNPALQGLLEVDRHTQRALVASNAEVVRRRFSLEAVGQQLRAAYAAVGESSPCGSQELEGSPILLDAFLNLARFHPIRVE
jgi:hypothetical protein